MKREPHENGKQQRKHDAVGREREGGHPIMPGRASEPCIGVQREIRGLAEQASLQRIHGTLQLLHRRDQCADDAAFGVELRISALEVVTDQPLDVSLVVLIRQALPRGEIEPGLIEAAAESLPVLCDEAGDESACDDGAHEQQSIEQSPDK